MSFVHILGFVLGFMVMAIYKINKRLKKIESREYFMGADFGKEFTAMVKGYKKDGVIYVTDEKRVKK